MNRARLADLLLAIAMRLLPRERAEWGAAMRAEAEILAGDRPVAWAAGCVFAAARARLKDPRSLYCLLLPLLAAAFVYVDWHTDETAISLAVFMAAAAALAFVRPERMVFTGIVVAAILIGAHAFADVTWIFVPYYQYKPLEPWEWLIIVSLIAPAMTGATIGGLTSRAFRQIPR
jgi:uncharacterized membrane protein YoaK (UPF0700 family)